jgi:Flp pilus assembly protein TadG
MSPGNRTVVARSAAGRARAPGSPPVERLGGDRGAALVEFALVLPLLVSLTLGIFGAGIVLNQRLSVTQAGREGARYGSTVPIDQCTPPANCSGSTWAKLVQDVTAERSAGAVTATNVCAALVQGPGTAPTALGASFTTAGGSLPCFVDESSDTGRRVQIRITLQTQIDTGLMTIPVTLVTEAVTRFEG